MRFLGSRGQEVQPRSAKSFQVFYGKKLVLGPKKFPARLKKVSDRNNFLINVVTRLERERAKIAAQKKAKKLREQRRLQRKKAEARKRTEAKKVVQAPIDFDAEEIDILNTGSRLERKERLAFEKVRAEKPITLKTATIEDVFVIPIIPDNDLYEKEVIEKVITTDSGQTKLDLSILNFTLNPEQWVAMDAENFEEAYRRAYILMFPHIIRFYKETRNSATSYIFRVKFVHDRKTKDGKVVEFEQGISLIRRENTGGAEYLMDMVRKTFARIMGVGPGPLVKRRNYLTGDTIINISGFTLEAAASSLNPEYEEKKR